MANDYFINFSRQLLYSIFLQLFLAFSCFHFRTFVLLLLPKLVRKHTILLLRITNTSSIKWITVQHNWTESRIIISDSGPDSDYVSTGDRHERNTRKKSRKNKVSSLVLWVKYSLERNKWGEFKWKMSLFEF